MFWWWVPEWICSLRCCDWRGQGGAHRGGRLFQGCAWPEKYAEEIWGSEIDQEGLKQWRGERHKFWGGGLIILVLEPKRRPAGEATLMKVATFTGRTPRYRKDVHAGLSSQPVWNRRLSVIPRLPDCCRLSVQRRRLVSAEGRTQRLTEKATRLLEVCNSDNKQQNDASKSSQPGRKIPGYKPLLFPTQALNHAVYTDVRLFVFIFFAATRGRFVAKCKKRSGRPLRCKEES